MASNPNSAPPAQYNISNILGIDVASNPTSPASTATQSQLYYPENNNPNLSPGTIVMAGGGAAYIFAQVSSVGSINTGDFVAFIASIASTFTVTELTSTYAALGCRVGVYQGSAIGYGNGASLPASGTVTTQWCWIALSGSNLVGNIVSTTSANVPLFVSSIAGWLSSASTTTYAVAGVSNQVSTASTVAPAPTAIVANPMMIMQPTSTSSTGFIGPF